MLDEYLNIHEYPNIWKSGKFKPIITNYDIQD